MRNSARRLKHYSLIHDETRIRVRCAKQGQMHAECLLVGRYGTDQTGLLRVRTEVEILLPKSVP